MSLVMPGGAPLTEPLCSDMVLSLLAEASDSIAGIGVAGTVIRRTRPSASASSALAPWVKEALPEPLAES